VEVDGWGWTVNVIEATCMHGLVTGDSFSCTPCAMHSSIRTLRDGEWRMCQEVYGLVPAACGECCY
jgi:hypothetical protein